ncbi:MAG: hypothetical protein OXI96_04885 [Acidimicrobiaceae bacterium]|nr:hypothetical protein [Acidimicrobiaceae bacterium]
MVELKSGYASFNGFEQLVQGLQVLHEYFKDGDLTVHPRAYSVAGRGLDKHAFSLRDTLADLRFGSQRSWIGDSPVW